ncbi:MAG: SDR family NAD(P)-dependent oxidoreductase [Clostridia bacterium]|nr:SDR family NAD(P)-dependent oxidoreductase [Clostridia bacterium]
MTTSKWIELNTKSLEGKTVAITGSTGGLGEELSEVIASLGAKLLFLNRNKSKTDRQIEAILQKHPSVKIEFVQVDMQDFESVKRACDELKRFEIDILILNAGAFNLPRKKTELGLDNVFQINFLSPYFMIKELLPQLKQMENSKIVVVGSIAHRYASFNEADIDYAGEKDKQKIYGNSKRFLMFSLFELIKKEEKVKLAVTHPGITATDITSNYPKAFRMIAKPAMKLIYMSPRKACLSVVKGVFDETEAYSWIGPARKNIWGYPKKRPLVTCSMEESKKIFTKAEEIYAKMKNEG